MDRYFGLSLVHKPSRESVNFIKLLRVPFVPIFLHQKITKLNVFREKLLNLLSYKKTRM